MSEKKYTEEELIEGGKTMMEGSFRFIDVFNWVKQRTPDDEEMRGRVLEKIKETEVVKAKLLSNVIPQSKKIDYVSLVTGILIMGAAFALYKMMLTTGYIISGIVIAFGFGFYMAFQAVFHGK